MLLPLSANPQADTIDDGSHYYPLHIESMDFQRV
jgi:hypothetical protein